MRQKPNRTLTLWCFVIALLAVGCTIWLPSLPKERRFKEYIQIPDKSQTVEQIKGNLLTYSAEFHKLYRDSVRTKYMLQKKQLKRFAKMRMYVRQVSSELFYQSESPLYRALEDTRERLGVQDIITMAFSRSNRVIEREIALRKEAKKRALAKVTTSYKHCIRGACFNTIKPAFMNELDVLAGAGIKFVPISDRESECWMRIAWTLFFFWVLAFIACIHLIILESTEKVGLREFIRYNPGAFGWVCAFGPAAAIAFIICGETDGILRCVRNRFSNRSKDEILHSKVSEEQERQKLYNHAEMIRENRIRFWRHVSSMLTQFTTNSLAFTMCVVTPGSALAFAKIAKKGKGSSKRIECEYDSSAGTHFVLNGQKVHGSKGMAVQKQTQQSQDTSQSKKSEAKRSQKYSCQNSTQPKTSQEERQAGKKSFTSQAQHKLKVPRPTFVAVGFLEALLGNDGKSASMLLTLRGEMSAPILMDQQGTGKPWTKLSLETVVSSTFDPFHVLQVRFGVGWSPASWLNFGFVPGMTFGVGSQPIQVKPDLEFRIIASLTSWFKTVNYLTFTLNPYIGQQIPHQHLALDLTIFSLWKFTPWRARIPWLSIGYAMQINLSSTKPGGWSAGKFGAVVDLWIFSVILQGDTLGRFWPSVVIAKAF